MSSEIRLKRSLGDWLLKLWPVLMATGMAFATGVTLLTQVSSLEARSGETSKKLSEHVQAEAHPVQASQHITLERKLDHHIAEEKAFEDKVNAKLDSIVAALSELKGIMKRGQRRDRSR